jgi:hypothetical protein
LFEELHHRESGGIQVSLLWNRRATAIAVLVVDTRTEEVFELGVAPERALDAFCPPLACAESVAASARLKQSSCLPDAGGRSLPSVA